MARPAIHSGSAVARWVQTSWLYQTATTPPRVDMPVLEEAGVLRALRRVPYAFPLLVATSGFVAVVAGFAGHGVASGMAATLVLAACLPRPALLLLPVLFIWAPRLNLAVAGDEVLFVRLDQAAVAGLLGYVLFHPRGRLRTPPAHTAILAFTIALAASVLVGILQGTLTTPTSSLLYLGQWLELYALYVLAVSLGGERAAGEKNSICSIESLRAYAWALPLIALAVYGLAESAWPYYEVPGVRYRTFERIWFPGQANHAGGLFALATATGFAMASRPRYRVLGLSLAVLSTLALFPTGSRSGVVAWAAGIAALALVYVAPARWWLPPLTLVALCAVPAAWWQRVSAPGSSMYDRLVAWKSALSTVDVYPLLGLGAGARHRSYYDNHYLMTLSESGILGLALLLLVLLCLARALAHGTRAARPMGWWQVGALAGLAALSVHALATATFVVTMVAGPFFWYCGMALAPPEESP